MNGSGKILQCKRYGQVKSFYECNSLPDMQPQSFGSINDFKKLYLPPVHWRYIENGILLTLLKCWVKIRLSNIALNIYPNFAKIFRMKSNMLFSK